MRILRNVKLSRRAWIVLGTAVVVAVVALSNRFGDNSGSATPVTGRTSTTVTATSSPTVTSSSTASTAPAAGPATSEPADDGAADTPTQAPSANAAARDAAVNFVAAYLNSYGKNADQWRAGYADKVTPRLAGLLADVDPDGDNATVVTPVTVTNSSDKVATVNVPISTGGTVTVTMVAGTHGWLANELSWNRP